MMYGYGYNGMMSGANFFSSLIPIVIFIDLVLVGVWLWKQIGKNNH